MAAWREQADAPLTRDGICLPHVHTGHLQADVFVATARLAAGLPAFLESARPERLEVHGADTDLARALTRIAEAAGIGATVVGAGQPPSYPIGFARSIRRGRLAPLREAVGLPGRPRGSVLIQSFRHLSGLWRTLPARGIEPVLDPAVLPALPPRELAARALRGGFLGNPGARARRRSQATLDEALAQLAEAMGGGALAEGDPVADLAARRAAELLRQLAGDTFARAAVFRAAARRGVRVAVVPSDTAAYARTFAAATGELGGSLVAVQHGFYGDLWRVSGRLVPYADGVEAERVALWSERDADRLRGTARGELVVTGNPGASAPAAAARGDAALVLLQPPNASTLAFDVRGARRYAEAALAGLTAARFTGPVVLRPHPLDRMDYRALGTVDSSGSLEEALRRARVCIGTMSTATLEAVVAGVPTVLLDVTGVPLPWPFDGSGALPRATDGAELAGALAALGTEPDPATTAAATEALGLRPDALERVSDLIAAAARR
jgi:hypothetical protein